MSERKLTEEARELSRAGVVVALDSAPRVQRMKAKLAECADAIEASRAREQRKDEALRRSENDWSFLFNLSDDLPLGDGILRELARANLGLIRQALAALPVETQEAVAPDDYTRPGWRMFPVL